MEFSVTIPLEQLSECGLTDKSDCCFLAPRNLAGRIHPAILDPAETMRMQSFRFEEDRERFLVAHGLKRIALGIALDCPPREIPLAFGLGNKPFISGGHCHFNLSHSGNWIAMLHSFKTPVGIDVEQPKSTQDTHPTALVCHPEDSFHAGLQTDDQRFYAGWTLKEAMSKWDGRGLDRPFNEIRLEALSGNFYNGHYEKMVWYARHTVLGDGTHLAYASEQSLAPSHILIS